MKSKVYIETSIISYLTARPSADLFVNANQLLAREWWNEHRSGFETSISQFVIDEISKGNPSMAKLRLEAVADVPLIESTTDSAVLTEEILRRNILPQKAAIDVAHIAVCCVHEIDYLLTLNCRHIANAFIYRRIIGICDDFGYQPPVICTLEQIMEKENKIDD